MSQVKESGYRSQESEWKTETGKLRNDRSQMGKFESFNPAVAGLIED